MPRWHQFCAKSIGSIHYLFDKLSPPSQALGCSANSFHRCVSECYGFGVLLQTYLDLVSSRRRCCVTHHTHPSFPFLTSSTVTSRAPLVATMYILTVTHPGNCACHRCMAGAGSILPDPAIPINAAELERWIQPEQHAMGITMGTTSFSPSMGMGSLVPVESHQSLMGLAPGVGAGLLELFAEWRHSLAAGDGF